MHFKAFGTTDCIQASC